MASIAESSEILRQFSQHWLPTGRDNDPIDVAKLASTLRAILEEVKKNSATISPTNMFSFKESAMQIHNMVKKFEADRSKCYRDLLHNPDQRASVDDFVNKVTVILGGQSTRRSHFSAPPSSLPTSPKSFSTRPASIVTQPPPPLTSPPQSKPPKSPLPIERSRTLSQEVAALNEKPVPVPSPRLKTNSPANGELTQVELQSLAQSVQWVAGILRIRLSSSPADVARDFQNGALFCQLINHFFPNTILTIHASENVRPYHCLENLKAFLTAARLKMGLTENQLFDTSDVLAQSDKAASQIGDTLKNFMVVAKTLERGHHAPASASVAVSPASSPQISRPPIPNLQLNQAGKSDHSSSSVGSLPSSFVKLSSTLVTKQDRLDAVNRKLSDYRMAVSIDEEGNIFRCVDSRTNRVTIQRLELTNPNFQEIEKLILFLTKADHPYVARVSTYWFELGYVYLEMPFYSHCTLKEWLLKQSPTPVEIQSMFSKILCGLAYLHENGIVHGRLSPEDVIVGQQFINNIDTYHPIICGLGQPPALFDEKNGRFRTSNGLVTEYLDIWLLGSILFWTSTGTNVIYHVDQSKKALPYPSMGNLSDPHLISALKCMLHKDPHRRPPASSLLLHPYFSKTFVLYSGSPFMDLVQVYKNISELKFQNHPLKGPLVLEVKRNQIVADVLMHFSQFEASDLIREISFVYSDSTPEESKNPTRTNASIVKELWKTLVYGGQFFEAYLYNRTVFLLPSSKVTDLDTFRLLGLLLFKFLFDRRSIPSSLAVLASNILAWAKTGRLENPSSPDLPEFDKAVISAYSNQLKALRNGLVALEIFTKISMDEFLVHSGGSEEFSGKRLLSRVEFYDFHLTSPTPSLVKDYFESLTHKQLRQFLLFASSQCGLNCLMPASGTDGNSLGFTEQDLFVKFIRKKGPSSKKQIDRIGCGIVEIFEFDDFEDLKAAFRQ